MNTNQTFQRDRVKQLECILRVMNDETFGRRKSERLVGGRIRLDDLIEKGKIRTDKRTNKQNGKWFCNAADVLKYAVMPN